MDSISELRDSLNGYLGWNKARMTCFVKTLLALMTTRTVNLNKLACILASSAKQSSRYRRCQRFFAQITVDYTRVAGFIFRLFFVTGGRWYLTMDRTNWQWGNTDINSDLGGCLQRNGDTYLLGAVRQTRQFRYR